LENDASPRALPPSGSLFLLVCTRRVIWLSFYGTTPINRPYMDAKL